MAYAAVISLKHTIHSQINNNIPINPQITNSAYEELDSLGCMLKRLDDDSSRSIDRSVIHDFDAEIRDAVWKLEDVLESSVLERFDEKGVEQEIHSFFNKMKKLREEFNKMLENPLPQEDAVVAVSSMDNGFEGNKSTTVGLSDLTKKIMNELLHDTPKLKSVSLVGMAGIGKTHLTREIYQHPLIVQHFHSRVWISLGPKYQTNKLSLDIVVQIEHKPIDQFKDVSVNKLRDVLKKSLHGRRYLIVLDDIWSGLVHEMMKTLLPQGQRNGSRIVVTTRLQEVAKYNMISNVHEMPFLNNEESWNLLWQNVFVDQKYFPSHLEKVGRKIAEDCEGLPLLILSVAYILRGLDKTEEYWNKVVEKKTTTFTDAYEQIYEVLLPSYEYLPQHLRACFLYMGVFRQGYEIPLSSLVNLWTVEDFLEPSWNQTLKGCAEESSEGLVSRSLAIVCKKSFERVRRIKSCKLHSVYWYLCVKEARKNKFFHVLKKLTDVYIETPRRMSVQNNMLFGLREVYDSMAEATSSTTRSLLFTGEDHQYPVRICFNMMLLKVLEALAIRFYEFPEEVLKLLQLRYLGLTHNGELPPSISKLRQLQCLILHRHHNIINLMQRDSTSCLPEEIWDLKELRHVRIMGSNLPDPSKDAQLWELTTLDVNAHSCRENVLRGIPLLRKLGIKIELQPNSAETFTWLEHIKHANGLASLKCVVVNPRSQNVVPTIDLLNIPAGLNKLSLNGLGCSWKDIIEIGSLRYLQVLKLRCYGFQGAEWETEALQFQKLEYLLLEDIDLVQWTANPRCMNSRDYKCFPLLRHLIVRHCYRLKKIPLEIGDIQTLERMEVDDCSPSVVDSAQRIKEKKRSLQLVINSSWNL